MDSDRNASDSENGGVKGQTGEKRSVVRRALQDVDISRAYLPLLVCCFISGLTDGTIYNGARLCLFCPPMAIAC